LVATLWGVGGFSFCGNGAVIMPRNPIFIGFWGL